MTSPPMLLVSLVACAVLMSTLLRCRVVCGTATLCGATTDRHDHNGAFPSVDPDGQI